MKLSLLCAASIATVASALPIAGYFGKGWDKDCHDWNGWGPDFGPDFPFGHHGFKKFKSIKGFGKGFGKGKFGGIGGFGGWGKGLGKGFGKFGGIGGWGGPDYGPDFPFKGGPDFGPDFPFKGGPDFGPDFPFKGGPDFGPDFPFDPDFPVDIDIPDFDFPFPIPVPEIIAKAILKKIIVDADCAVPDIIIVKKIVKILAVKVNTIGVFPPHAFSTKFLKVVVKQIIDGGDIDPGFDVVVKIAKIFIAIAKVKGHIVGGY